MGILHAHAGMELRCQDDSLTNASGDQMMIKFT